MFRIALILSLLLVWALSFSPQRQSRRGSSLLADSPPDKFELPPDDFGKLEIFTGGAFDKQEAEAAKIASKIRSVKDLGWTQPAKRAGSIRPRHRAFGGQGENPIQMKPNYDETMDNCVEKWLTQENFNKKFRVEGPAADTVFVALAEGSKYAERDICEKKIASWRNGNSFDEAAFLKTVQAGRTDLAIGWALFLTVSGICVGGILFPTNPFQKILEGVIDQVKDQLLVPPPVP